ncbi:SatD family protein [Sabulilitoribacter multivorans]|uniref:SatD family protein n=1 Tax=Flaviramulus multivorans TaxID=1304750 RepID=A0ABS9IMK9_9FLAO|nr:SatD family protein [Flaviramulus multivorans]MCF7561831.1 SatD family protein [Flaviramulus multivorans]
MIAIITGDIINSKTSDPKIWLHALKGSLNRYGLEPKVWEVFRGDSFQLETKPKQALEAAFLIKATIKQFKNIDVRLAIGIGDKTYESEKITESNGSAFVNSGECFEGLKKTTLAIKSPNESFNITMNLMFDLVLLTIDSWTATSAKLIKTALENPDLNQEQLAKLYGSTQSNISKGLKRGGIDEILKLLYYYETQIKKI